MVSTRPRNPSQKTRVYAYARASAAHRSAVQLSVPSIRDDEKSVFVRFLSIFREESSSESMRRRARRLSGKCRPKVERTCRHSLIVAIAAPVRRALDHRSKKRERDGRANTYESTGIVCSGASNSFGGAMMIFFDGASRCVL